MVVQHITVLHVQGFVKEHKVEFLSCCHHALSICGQQRTDQMVKPNCYRQHQKVNLIAISSMKAM
jgi:hypothetical protein